MGQKRNPISFSSLCPSIRSKKVILIMNDECVLHTHNGYLCSCYVRSTSYCKEMFGEVSGSSSQFFLIFQSNICSLALYTLLGFVSRVMVERNLVFFIQPRAIGTQYLFTHHLSFDCNSLWPYTGKSYAIPLL